VKSTDLRPGMAIKMDGNIFVITQFTHVTPGNLRAFIQIKIKRVPDGQVLDKRLRSGEEVEAVSLDRRSMEYLYQEREGYVFMDNESYDQVTVSEELLKDSIKYIKPNTSVITLVVQDNVVALELPKTVELQVTDTPPGIKGATVTNVGKEATLETGLVTRVPEFIAVGETIRISTEDGSYLSRASS
jgi:elongation factor P